MTQSELARALGLPQPMVISNWERGVYRPSEENFCALARTLGQEMAWFYTDHDEPVAA
jgi:transcriptional regulator with XRE-family HTH domain